MAVFSEGQLRLLQAIRDYLWPLPPHRPWPYAPCQHQTIGQIKVPTGQHPGEMLWEEQEEAESSSSHDGLPGILLL